MTEVPPNHGALRDHVADCAACRADPPPLDGLEAVLGGGDIGGIDVRRFSRRVVERLQPELSRRARAVYRREVAAAVLVGVLPLPAVLLYNAYVLHLVYHLIALVLPGGVAAYLVATYAAFLVLLYGVTYAAVPLLMGRHDRMGAAAPT